MNSAKSIKKLLSQGQSLAQHQFSGGFGQAHPRNSPCSEAPEAEGCPVSRRQGREERLQRPETPHRGQSNLATIEPCMEFGFESVIHQPKSVRSLRA